MNTLFLFLSLVKKYVFISALLSLFFLSACAGKVSLCQDLPDGVMNEFYLSKPGQFYVSKTTYEFKDAAREDRIVSITVWYPALLSKKEQQNRRSIPYNRKSDLRGAPYPLILSSTKMALVFAPTLVSHGFVWASVDNINTYVHMNPETYHQPLDILFALDKVALEPPEGLQGMINADMAGTIGYSFDGYNSLAMSGARLDPDYYLSQCSNEENAHNWKDLSAFYCGPAEDWDAFSSGAGVGLTNSEDELWQPMTDERIRAVAPLAAEGYWLFGKRGLSFVDRPVLMMAGTRDGFYLEDTMIYGDLGTKDKIFISFLGEDHYMLFEKELAAIMAHFATAFFGYHLQGCTDYAAFLSETFASQFDGLTWGTID